MHVGPQITRDCHIGTVS